jgi:hypothetical protein
MDAMNTDEHHPNEGYLMPNDVVFENPYILPEDGLSFLVTRVDEFVNGKWTNIIWEPEYEPFLFQIRSNVQFLVPHPVMIARTWHLDHSDEIWFESYVGGYPAQLSTCTERKVLIPFGTKRKVEFADEGGDILFLQRYNTVVSNNSRTSVLSLDMPPPELMVFDDE